MAMGTHTIQILSSQSNFVLLMKVLKAISILVIGPILGILVAFFLGVLALPADPNFVANGGHAAPGDGFLTMGLIFLALIVSVPLSAIIAGFVLFQKPKNQVSKKALT
jgi:TRAP-type C4-dicarboxylate transport system permease small subunit